MLPKAGAPRSVDLWPIFHTGVPNLEPYQLATGKTGHNPLTSGKPFINNFLPNGGDMLRLNMAVPVTPRTDPNFSSLGLVQAAVLGLTAAPYNTNTNIEFIPNMDGFPNGRRLEDDVTRIELQAVGGVVLAAIGLWYDDFDTAQSPVTPNLVATLGYSTNVESNDTTFRTGFPFVQVPWKGNDNCLGKAISYVQPAILPSSTTGINDYGKQYIETKAYPNPMTDGTTISFILEEPADVNIKLMSYEGKLLSEEISKSYSSTGKQSIKVNTQNIANGLFFAKITVNNSAGSNVKLIKLIKQ